MGRSQELGEHTTALASHNEVHQQGLTTQQQLPEEPSPPLPPPCSTGLLRRWAAAAWGCGVFCILGAAFAFSIAAALVKAIDGQVGVFEIIFVRSGLSMAASAAVARASDIAPLYGQRAHWPLLFGRGLAGASAMALFYESILRLPLADCITILFCNPAICAILGWILIGERFGLLTVAGCLASLAGVVMVAQPPFLLHWVSGGGTAAAAVAPQQEWTHDRMVGMSLGVAGAFLAALAYILIRTIGKREQSLTIAMWFHSVACFTSIVPMLLGVPRPPTVPGGLGCLAMLGVGCCSFSAQLLLNRGFQLELAARAAAYNYTQVIWANLLGILFFGEVLTILGVAGAALIAVGIVVCSVEKRPAAAAAASTALLPEQRGPAFKSKSSFKLEEEEGQGLLLHPGGDYGRGRGAPGGYIALQPLPAEEHLYDIRDNTTTTLL